MAKSAISLLQEYYQGRNGHLPVYEMSRVGADHRPEFTCKVTTADFTAEGTGTSKKEAKENCARNALMLLENKIRHSMSPPSRVCALSPQTTPNKSPTIIHNYIGKLNEHASQKRLPQPVYQEIQYFSLGSPNFQIECTYMSFKTTGSGTNKKSAKHCAAEKMWENVTNQTDMAYIPLENLPTPTKKLVLIEEDTFEVINKFKELSVNKPAPVQENKFMTSNVMILDLDNVDEVDDLEYKLRKHNFKYTISVFQQKPLIAKLEGENGIILLQLGKTMEAAKPELLKCALGLIQVGCNPKEYN